MQGTTMAKDLAMTFDAGAGQPEPENNVQENINVEANQEHPFNQRAREMANESTQPQ